MPNLFINGSKPSAETSRMGNTHHCRRVGVATMQRLHKLGPMLPSAGPTPHLHSGRHQLTHTGLSNKALCMKGARCALLALSELLLCLCTEQLCGASKWQQVSQQALCWTTTCQAMMASACCWHMPSCKVTASTQALHLSIMTAYTTHQQQYHHKLPLLSTN